jgi:hypothetical protein
LRCAISLRGIERHQIERSQWVVAPEVALAFHACADALEAHNLAADLLTPQCTRRGAAVQFMMRAAELRLAHSVS